MRIAAVIACLLLAGSPVHAQPATQVPAGVWEPEASEIPATAAGKCAAAYFKAFNADDAAAREFESTFRSPAALKERSLESRVAMYADLRQQWGRVQARSVLDTADGHIVVLGRAAASQQWLIYEFQFEPDGKLKAIQIDGPIEADELRQRLEPVDDQTRQITIKAIAHQLRKEYVFPEVADKMAAALGKNAEEGRYANVSRADDLARMLTEDLRAVCHDKHLRVRLNTGGQRPGGMIPGDEARRNYGFVRAEVLPNNIGYIRFDGFSASDEAREAAAAAMAFVARCDALIFDVRQNGGGSPRMVEFLGGYLYESPTVLNAFFDRKGRRVSQTRTLETVPGAKVNPAVPVYVLTSGRTFSCAEEFSYDLQTTKRGIIVGETTGGGAHPVKGVPLNDRFMMMIPYERAENPITHGNWEGKGVEPDIRVPAEQALDAAVADAVRRVGSSR